MADQILFDRLAYIDKLKSAGIDEAQARAHGEALDAALRDSVATHADITAVRTDLEQAHTNLEHRIDIAVRDMTIRTGAMLIVLGGFLASIKFFGWSGRMSMKRQSARIRKLAVADARWRPEVVVDPLSLRAAPSKAELREQPAEAVASYNGPITRCAPKRRKAP